jgi:hypothetical protein
LRFEKKVNISNKQTITWTHAFTDSISINFELQSTGKMDYFEVTWGSAVSDANNWICWSSDAYKSRNFAQRLEDMGSEAERVLKCKEEFKDDYARKDLSKLLGNLSRLDKAKTEIENFYAKEEEDNVKFEYQFPPHLEEMLSSTHELKKWFQEECISDKDRRKALVLYSEHRALGKTKFAESLVGYREDLIVYIRGQDTAKENFDNQQIAKLLLLDDYAPGSRKEEEMKAFVVGQGTNVRGCGFSLFFTHGLPTVLTVNRKTYYKSMQSDPMFKTSCIFIEVESYMGPPGTEPLDHQNDMKGVVRKDKINIGAEVTKKKMKKKKTHTICCDESSNSNSLPDYSSQFSSISNAQFRLVLDVVAYWDALKTQKPNVVVNHNYYNGMLNDFSENFMNEYVKMREAYSNKQNSEKTTVNKKDWFAESHQEEKDMELADRMLDEASEKEKNTNGMQVELEANKPAESEKEDECNATVVNNRVVKIEQKPKTPPSKSEKYLVGLSDTSSEREEDLANLESASTKKKKNFH